MKYFVAIAASFFAGSLFFLVFCMDLSKNPFDPNNPDYVLPSMEFINNPVPGNDTVSVDSLCFVVRGNYKANFFRWRMEDPGSADTAWTDWAGDDRWNDTIILTRIQAGPHRLHIQTAYHRNGDITDAAVEFVKVDCPVITRQSDSLIQAATAQSCTLWVAATGTPPLSYQWYRDSGKLGGKTGDTLVIPFLTVSDTGRYRCVVSNPWGVDTSEPVRIAVAPGFRVRYNGNKATGGTVPVDSNYYKEGTAVTVKGNTGVLTRAGHVFAAWNAAAGGDGKTYAPGDTIAIGSADKTLFAKWTRLHTVTYSGNGNTGGAAPVDSAAYEQGAAVTVKANSGSLVKTGSAFTDWNTRDDGAGKSYGAGVTFSMDTADVRLYAKWTPVVYSITYDLNDGINDPANPSSYTIESPTITLKPATKTGYSFNGWFPPFSLVTVTTIPKGSTGNKTFSARWIVKDIDGNVYSTVTLGSQVWMVENLKTTKYNDGKGIPLVADSAAWCNLATPGYCWYNNNANSKATFGALYNWHAVHTGKLAPEGWHVPTDAEWDILQNYLITKGYNWDNTTSGNKIAKSMASKTSWSVSANPGAVGNNPAANDRSGFSGFPGGLRNNSGGFANFGLGGYWWSATETAALIAWMRLLYYEEVFLYKVNFSKSSGISVRLIHD